MEQTFYYIIVGALIFEYTLSTLSSVLNMNSIDENIPSGFEKYYDKKKYSKSQLYLRDKTLFGLFSSTFSLLIVLLIIHKGLFGDLDSLVSNYNDNQIIRGLMFFGILFFINDFINIPFSIYSTFVIEEKYGFNKTTVKTYILDKLKGYALTIILGTLIMSPILYFFNAYNTNGWLIAWGIVTAFMIAVQPLFVHVIAPMFNKFTSLEEGDLRSAIENFNCNRNSPLPIFLFRNTRGCDLNISLRSPTL